MSKSLMSDCWEIAPVFAEKLPVDIIFCKASSPHSCESAAAAATEVSGLSVPFSWMVLGQTGFTLVMEPMGSWSARFAGSSPQPSLRASPWPWPLHCQHVPPLSAQWEDVWPITMAHWKPTATAQKEKDCENSTKRNPGRKVMNLSVTPCGISEFTHMLNFGNMRL